MKPASLPFHPHIDASLADIQAVGIATPDFAHGEIALAAIQAGKHVLVEKPMDLTVEGCDQMIEAARKSGFSIVSGRR